MLRVLQVLGVMRRAGAQSMVMNFHRNIDRSKVQFDYLSIITEEESYPDYEEEIKALGGKLYKFERSSSVQLIRYDKFMRRFLNEHPEYKIVHCHVRKDSIVPLYEAKRAGRITIMHSHNTKLPVHSPKQFFGNFLEYLQRYVADYFFACSKAAGIDQFGKGTNFTFVPNGIDTEPYKFSQDIRRSVRENRGITSESTLIVGHVGTFGEIKNQDFLVDVFRELHERRPDSKLWLIGRGPLKEATKAKVHSMGLDDAVDFIGITDRVNEYLMGMDIFAFPSLLEGLGIALIEAEASGLPCVVSDRIQDEAIVSDRVTRLAITPPTQCVKLWLEAIERSAGIRDLRETYAHRVKQSGFDVQEVACKIQEFYLSLV